MNHITLTCGDREVKITFPRHLELFIPQMEGIVLPSKRTHFGPFHAPTRRTSYAGNTCIHTSDF